MMKNLVIKLAVTLVFGFCISNCANCTDWYVDNAASGTINGTSWTNAWQSFADIDWVSIEPGDILYISGGSGSKTYNERLSLDRVNGSEGMPVTIKVGQTAGHNGEVIITSDGPNAGIFFMRSTYITVDGNVGNNQNMKIENCSVSGIMVYSGCHHIILTYLDVNNNGDERNEHGIALSNLNNFDEIYPTVEISHCKIHSNYHDQINGPSGEPGATKFGNIIIHDNEIYDLHDDGVESGYGGIDFYNNVMHTRAPGGAEGHPDGVQLFGNFLRIYNNVFCNFNHPDLISNAYIYHQTLQDVEGNPRPTRDVYIYNNLIYDDQIYDYNALRGIEFGSHDGDCSSIDRVVIANNTIIGTPVYGLSFKFHPEPGRTSNCIIANNIVHNCNTNNARMGILITNAREDEFCSLITDYVPESDFCDGVFFDYNLFSAGANGSDVVSLYNEFVTYEELTQIHHVNVNGVNADPSLDASYRPDSSTDPGVANGINLSGFFNYDLDGKLRSSNWDIGAYEYNTIINDSTEEIQLFQNYPNPFIDNTTIEYNLPEELFIEISLFDILGRKTHILFRGNQSAGEHTLDVTLNNITTGMYFYKLQAGNYSAIKKCIAVK